MRNSSRRDFLGAAGSCAAHLALAALVTPRAVRSAWAASPGTAVVAREPFGYLEKVVDGVWALISTPLSGDRTTLANGGIIAGRNGVLAIEAFFQPRGAEWLAAKSREITGRWPTHVVLTHYHSDHANGVAGYMGEARPTVRATDRTRQLILERNTPADSLRADVMRDVVVLRPSEREVIDLGGRSVTLTPRSGHTDSDLSVELGEPNVVFTGDLVWNGMFPNFVDARPSQLAAAVQGLPRTRDTVYVPGHGTVARAPEFDRYLDMLAEVERAARAAKGAGRTAAEGAARFALPASLGDWTLFNKVFFERAFAAWYRELP